MIEKEDVLKSIREVVCPICAGCGTQSGTVMSCSVCHGTGKVRNCPDFHGGGVIEQEGKMDACYALLKSGGRDEETLS